MTDKKPLEQRLEDLLHPIMGIMRGIIEADEKGKGGRDPDDMLINIRVGELREIRDVLMLLKEERNGR